MWARAEAPITTTCAKVSEFGVLYVENGDDGMSSLANQVEFLHKQYSLGNSHRFTSVLDCGLINNHDYCMVLQNRPGPTLKALLEAAPSAQLAPTSAAFIAIDLISTAELLASTGYNVYKIPFF
ncbi:unnamed protein product [Caenorhabditis sp. 36 PRJEB53466]|nr:unnamed protein product [Caenorhabditis sp. 36 PRJEB53466]